MKTLIVYDSVYGNTEQIARALGNAITPAGSIKVVKASEVSAADVQSIDFLLVGSPTQGGRPTLPVHEFITRIPESILKSIKVASFDTRLSTRWVGIFGFAAGKIAENLKNKGASLAVAPEPFFVKGKEGPLKEGELERAAAWVKGIPGMK